MKKRGPHKPEETGGVDIDKMRYTSTLEQALNEARQHTRGLLIMGCLTAGLRNVRNNAGDLVGYLCTVTGTVWRVRPKSAEDCR